MSGQIELPRTRYLGIMNGVVYRIESNIDGSERMFELVPLETKPAGIDDSAATALKPPPLPPALQAGISALSSSAPAATSEPVARPQAHVAKPPVQKDESAVRLFPRDGAEPLRAGHPDLWHLLVAGTSLEGSTFKFPQTDAETAAPR